MKENDILKDKLKNVEEDNTKAKLLMQSKENLLSQSQLILN
jgi:hypothetical protein